MVEHAVTWLTTEERAQLLGELLAGRDDLQRAAEQWACEQLGTVDPDEVRDAVVDDFLDQPFTEISGRAGRQPGRGYVHEVEAQYELLSETMQPWLDDMRRRQGAGFPDAASRVAVGVMRGLAELAECAPEDSLIGWGDAGEHARCLADDVLHWVQTWELPMTEELRAEAPPAWAGAR